MPHAHLVLFTFHAYATWIPDRPQGYYRNHTGLCPTNVEEAAAYRRRQREPAADLAETVQRSMIEELLAAAQHQRLVVYAAATDDAHLHAVMAWEDDRTPDRVQFSLKGSLTRRLNASHGRRRWLGRNGHDRRVRDGAHFRHLCGTYLPSHRGWRWDRRFGWREPRGLHDEQNLREKPLRTVGPQLPDGNATTPLTADQRSAVFNPQKCDSSSDVNCRNVDACPTRS